MCRHKKVILLGLACLFSCVQAFSAKQSPRQRCILLGKNPSLIIKFKQELASKVNVVASLQSKHVTFTHSRPMHRGRYVVFFSPKPGLANAQVRPGCYDPAALESMTQELKTENSLEYADPNELLKLDEVKKKYLVPIIDPVQWDMLTAPGGIEAQTAFNTTTGSTNAITAVFDSGSLTNGSLNPNELTGATFKDGGTVLSGATPSCDSSCGSYDHGTHVAGTVAASGTLYQGEQIYGVAPTSRLLPINVFTKVTDSETCDGSPPCLLSSTSDQINAMDWLDGESFEALGDAPHVVGINMSLGGSGSCSLSRQTAIDNLIAKNISFAVAAGNEDEDASGHTPANCADVMTIAATGPTGYRAYYSNYGSDVTFAAPGGDLSVQSATIYSTIEDGYGYKQGTSMATPHVAGLVALMYSLDPTLTPATVTTLIADNVTSFPSGGTADNDCVTTKSCGSGIINAASTVTATVAQAPTITWTPALSFTEQSNTQVTLTWSAAAWSEARSTGIVYTVNRNGVDLTECTTISATSCVMTDIVPTTIYTVYVKATDERSIYTPVSSSSIQFATTNIPPTLSAAIRNPMKLTQAFIYYSAIGYPIADSYTLNNLPAGTTYSLNTSKSRFEIDNITTPKRIYNVSVTGDYSGEYATSNAIDIPSIL